MKTFSQAGRTTLISSVVVAMPSYQASSLLLPKKVCEKLDILNRNFWWGCSDEKNHGLYLKSLDSICTPKAMGGLGINKTKDMNRALVAKLTWEVASNAKKFWVKMFQKKYVRGKNFMKMPMPKSISWSSQSIFWLQRCGKKRALS